jgi:hypothetical protein
MTITRKDPVREAFSGYSTGNVPGPYYETKGHAVMAFDAALRIYDYHLACDDTDDFHDDEGRKIIDVLDDSGEIVGQAVISWYRMPSGRYEFIGYLA